MKKSKKYSILILLLSTLFVFSCDEDNDLIEERLAENPLPGQGDAGTEIDITNFVAIGNSLTAGFADGALYPIAQSTSVPAIVAAQFALVGGGEFNQPNTTSQNGFGDMPNDSTIVGRSFINTDPAAPVTEAIVFTTGSALQQSTVTNNNNFGVPGARVIDAVAPGYGQANPFYGAFQSSPMASMLGDAIAAEGTFFSVWLGGNDALGYGISGGVFGEEFVAQNPNTLTSVEAFSGALTTVLDGMSANGAEGVILNIPPITIIPFFQVVTQLSGGINLIPVENIEQATAINAGYAEYIGGLNAALALGLIDEDEVNRRIINFEVGANPPVITDENSITQNVDISAAFGAPQGSVILPNLRQATVDPTTGLMDLFPLTALTEITGEPNSEGQIIGITDPVPDQFTLTISEQSFIIGRVAQFNGVIAAEAAARDNIALVDTHPVFADLFGLSSAQAAGLALSAEGQSRADGEFGLNIGGITLLPLDLSLAGLFASVFSSDGIHPNPRGSALIANEIVLTINEEFNAELLPVDILSFPGIRVN